MRYVVAIISGTVFGYVSMSTVAIIVVNALYEGPPITAIDVLNPFLFVTLQTAVSIVSRCPFRSASPGYRLRNFHFR